MSEKLDKSNTPAKPRPHGARKLSLQERELLRHNENHPAVSHGYFNSYDGTRLFYSIEGTGKPLIFCYGLVCSSLHWTYQIEHFRRSYKTVWFDYRGHQNSDAPKDLNTLSVDCISRDLETLLDELKIEDAVFLGHSMGVNVLLDFYKRNPKRVHGMVLCNGTPRRPLESLFKSNATEAVFKLLTQLENKAPTLVKKIWPMQKRNPVLKSLIRLGGFNPNLTPREDIDLYVDQVAEMDPKVFVHLINNYSHYDATAWLHKINVPSLILGGERDRVIPKEEQELMAQLIPSSQLEIIKHGSHCPQMDMPEFINGKVDTFLKSLKY
ncbi:alpha/beta hydrolase [bacterium]|jgi:pimeloyl-ACP methyl ester carboxylesterase|nr:alpha/beta hydrolase [bacterium]